MGEWALHRKKGDDRFREIDFHKVDDAVAAGDIVWINIVTDDADVIKSLSKYNVKKSIIEDAAGQEQLPKYEVYTEELYVVLHALGFHDQIVDTTQINCVLEKNLFITTSEHETSGIRWLWKQVQGSQYGSKANQSDDLFGALAVVIGHHYLDVINTLDDLIDDVYDRALTARRHVLSQIQLLRREATSISKVIRPQTVVLNDLRNLQHPRLTDEGREICTNAFDVHNLVMRSLESARSLLADALDTYRGATGDRQSTASTILAVYSAVMLPLTVIGGFYGMNVPLPGEKSQYSVIIITAVMLAIAAASLIVFYKVGFIRFSGFRVAQPSSALKRASEAGVTGEHSQTRQYAEAESRTEQSVRAESARAKARDQADATKS